MNRYLIPILILLYIAIEIAFRSELVTYVSSVMHYSEVYFVEFSGRFIAAIGFALFVYQIVNKRLGLGARFLVVVVSFLGFFAAEKGLINLISSSLSDESRAKAVLLVNYKESLILGLKDDPLVQAKMPTAAERTRIAFVPIANLSNESLLRDLKVSRAKDIEAVLAAKNKKFYELNQPVFQSQLEALTEIYYGALIASKEAKRFTGKDYTRAKKVWSVVVSRAKNRYLEKSYEGEELRGKYRTLNAFYRSEDGRDFILKGKYRTPFMNFSSMAFGQSYKLPIPQVLHPCLLQKPWPINSFDSFLKYTRVCLSERYAKALEANLMEKGIEFHSKHQPDIFIKGFEPMFRSGYFSDVVSAVAPFLKRPEGGLYERTMFDSAEGVKKIAGGLAKGQARELLAMIDNPAGANASKRQQMVLESYGKEMIIPPLMIVISTIMIIMNLVKFSVGITLGGRYGALRHGVTVVLLCGLVALPWWLSAGTAGQFKQEGDMIGYLRAWSEKTSEQMAFVDHRAQPFKAVLNGITIVNIIIQSREFPILSTGAIDDESFRMAAQIRLKEMGQIDKVRPRLKQV